MTKIKKLVEDMNLDEKVNRILEQQDRIIEQQEEIMEKLDNLSRDGADFTIETY